MNINLNKHLNKSIILIYTVIGVIFGSLFPILAITFQAYISDNIEFISLEFIRQVHDEIKLMYMIDSAPIFLGGFAFIAGFLHSKLDVKNNELKIMINRDELTGAYNRRFGKQRIIELMNNNEDLNKNFSIAFLDLDKFKYINDTAGHDFGDKVLKIIAQRLVNIIEEKDIIRLGGDEFMIIFRNESAMLDDKLNEISREIEKPIFVDDKTFFIESSIGVVHYPEHGQDISSLLKKADVAMYNCKKTTKINYCIFNDIMLERMERTVMISNALDHVIENNELFLVYQPIVKGSTKEVIALGALLRWKNIELNELISPVEFISIAEQNGTIIPIGYWIIEEVCRFIIKYRNKFNLPKVAINISAIQLKERDFVEKVSMILDNNRIEPNCIEFEITESNSMKEIENSKEILKQLKKMGINISMDDFGTGHSSLSELKKMMIDYIKIDKSFIDDIHININDTLIVEAMIAMAKSLKIEIIAEGVETQEQFRYLQERECDYIQGYLFSKPLMDYELIEKYKNKFSI